MKPSAIKRFLEERQMTQSKLAELIGVRPWAVGSWISGEREPSEKHRRKLSYLLSLPLDTDISTIEKLTLLDALNIIPHLTTEELVRLTEACMAEIRNRVSPTP